MKILFMGTPEISRTVLKALINAGHEIVLAVTQPDRAKGRSKALQFSPVKEEALLHGIPVFQPQKLRTPEAEAELAELLRENPAEAGVVVAFGQILTQNVLDMPKYGCINIHASLLPKYRGAAPITQAILDGCEITGVTTMQMDAGIDTGDILLQRELPILPDDTTDTLTARLAELGGKLIVETLAELEKGSLRSRPQEGEASYVKMIRKEQGHIDWSLPAQMIERMVRGFTPWPGAYTFRNGKMLKLLKAEVLPESVPGNAVPGTVVRAAKNDFTVQTGEGLLKLLELQPEGKKAMDCGAYLRGAALKEGELLV